MRSCGLKTILAALFLCVAAKAFAVPARPGIIKIHQPDGSAVEVIIRGDEFGHVMTTPDGCAVMRGRDGYCCYARFAADGSRINTGVRVGQDRTGAVEAASRAIPYARISEQAARRRMSARLSRPAPGSYVETRSSSSSHRAVILLAQFSDLRFTHDRSAFVDLLTKKGYSYKGATGSALDYFNDQFKGAAEFTFDFGPVVTLSRGYAYYGENGKDEMDLRPAEAVAEACRLSDAQVDFSLYDYVYVFYAGGSEADGGADADHIWPHSWNLVEAGINLVLDGRRIGAYAMSSELMNVDAEQLELTGIGTFCHEYSHTLGLVDMYDTDYEKSGGESEALWRSTAIMDGGNYNNFSKTPPGYNAIELEMLGLVKPETLDYGKYTLEPLSSSHRVLRLDTDTRDEYFLFEARQALGWDKYIGGGGLLVYHIDRSSAATGYSPTCEMELTAAERWEYNEVNCNPKHQCADLVEAYRSARDVSQVFFPYGSVNSLSGRSNTAFRYWNGKSSLMVLNKISKVNGTVSFTVNGPLVVDVRDVYQDAVILNWHTDMEDLLDRPAYVRWTAGGVVHEEKVYPYEPGLFAYTVEGLQGGTDYEISIVVGSSQTDMFTSVEKITTKPQGGQPFIYVSDASRNSVGKFTVCTKIPLRVYNLRNVRQVRWYWDGEEITAGKDGYFELLRDGMLKAVVTYIDGTEEIFVKKISIR